MSERKELWMSMDGEHFDVIIIGGGVTGAGIALDAQSRGLKTLLIERRDYAYGTSSRSTKLIHGGLRYLKQLEVGIVREVGVERQIVYQNARHLVRPEKMVLPIYPDGSFSHWAASIGLWVYDLVAGVSGNDKRQMLSPEQTLLEVPELRSEGLEGAGYYAEYRTDDARLTGTLIQRARDVGATCINYGEVFDFQYNLDEEINGVNVRDTWGDLPSFTTTADYIINAAGPWVDLVRKLDEPKLTGKQMVHSRGVHIVVPRHRLPLEHAVYFDVPDGRMLFAIPRLKTTYIGTTDVIYNGSLDKFRVEQEEVTYLLDGTNQMFPAVQLGPKDIKSSWVGVRPLLNEKGKETTEISRKDEIFQSESGLITIAGGKLTGYRRMAEKVMNLVAILYETEHQQSIKPCQTRSLPLTVPSFDSEASLELFKEEVRVRLSSVGFTEDIDLLVDYLVLYYGYNCLKVLALYDEQLSEGMAALLQAEFQYGVEQEQLLTLSDFWIRRTGRLYFDIESVRLYREVIANQAQQLLDLSSEALYQQQADLTHAIEVSTEFI